MGSKVNGRLVPLESELLTGDVVEVFTSKNPDSGPSKDWLGFVKSPRARNKIRQWFTKERRDEAIEQGRDAIARAMRKQNLPLQKLMNHDSFAEVAALLKYEDVSALYAAVGEGHVSTQSVLEKVVSSVQSIEDNDSNDFPVAARGRAQTARNGDSGVLVRGAPDILVKLARCCTPVPGDKIVGFVTRGSGVSVHQAACHNVQSLLKEPERMIEVEWAPTSKSLFLVHIQIEALDRAGLLSDVTRVLSEHHVNILSATVNTSSDRLAVSRFVFEMGDTTHLDRVLNAVRRIDAVYDVYRVSDG
jgi:GTP pyrophosphokinase